ncbi:hypothetical protein KHP62_01225 [Rhodobacteraceae bacterium NNCM2]|nr:hypothetical protein [Coraliihabitans acroporae]
MNKVLKWLVVLATAYLIAVGLFGAGWLVRHKNLWPNDEITETAQTIKRFAETQSLVPSGLIHARPKDSSGARFEIVDPGRYLRGYRAVMGWDDARGRFSIWLYGPEGELLHTWPVDLETLGIPRIAAEGLNPHGMAVLPDGSVLVNFSTGAEAVARIDGCGAPVWLREGVFHHSIHLTEDGGFWTLENDLDPLDLTLSLTEIDAETGETRRRISLLEDVFPKDPQNAMVLRLPESFAMAKLTRRGDYEGEADLWHGNDVEPLSTTLAPAFPMFEAGDLLISLRNIHLVAVLDPDTLRFKWWQWGPWTEQHDPDFAADGRIWVYNNGTGRGRTDVVAVDPATGAMERFFSSGPVEVYSAAQGELSVLGADLVQIVVPFEGRVIEATTAGEVVLEMANPIDTETNARVMNAEWLPPDYFTALPACP